MYLHGSEPYLLSVLLRVLLYVEMLSNCVHMLFAYCCASICRVAGVSVF